MTNPKPPANESAPKTDDITHIAKLRGVDRSGLGPDGWAEVPEDRIGGHPELEDTGPRTPPQGGLNGKRPTVDPATGAAADDEVEQ